jgi:hypothetical protein
MPAKDILDMLVADGVLTAGGTDGFHDKEPGENDVKTDNPIAIIYNTGGFDPEATGKTFDKPTVNVRVKGIPSGVAAARTLIQNIKAALHQRTPETRNNTRYMGIWQIGEIAFVEYDTRNRPIYTANFRMHRTYA